MNNVNIARIFIFVCLAIINMLSGVAFSGPDWGCGKSNYWDGKAALANGCDPHYDHPIYDSFNKESIYDGHPTKHAQVFEVPPTFVAQKTFTRLNEDIPISIQVPWPKDEDLTIDDILLTNADFVSLEKISNQEYLLKVESNKKEDITVVVKIRTVSSYHFLTRFQGGVLVIPYKQMGYPFILHDHHEVTAVHEVNMIKNSEVDTTKDVEVIKPTVSWETGGTPLSVYIGGSMIENNEKASLGNHTDFADVKVGDTRQVLGHLYNKSGERMYIKTISTQKNDKYEEIICCKDRPLDLKDQVPEPEDTRALEDNLPTPRIVNFDYIKSMTIIGPNAKDFHIRQWFELPGRIPNLRRINDLPFEISFTPSSPGEKKATIIIKVTDDNRGTYVFTLHVKGNGEHYAACCESHTDQLFDKIKEQYDNYSIAPPNFYGVPIYFSWGKTFSPTVCKSETAGDLPARGIIQKSIDVSVYGKLGQVYNRTNNCFTFDVKPELGRIRTNQPINIEIKIANDIIYSQDDIESANNSSHIDLVQLRFDVRLNPSDVGGGYQNSESANHRIKRSAKQLAVNKDNGVSVKYHINNMASVKNNLQQDKYLFNINGSGSNNNGMFYTDTNSLYSNSNKYNLWNMTKWNHYKSKDKKNDQLINTLGIDYNLTKNLIFGFIGQLDTYNESSDIESDDDLSSESKGWLVGPYFVHETDKGGIFNIYLGVGKSNNILMNSDSETDTFNSTQIMVLSNLNKSIKYYDGKLILTPYVDFEYNKVKQYDFNTHSGVTIDDYHIVFGDIEAGVKATFNYIPNNESNIRLSAGLNTIGDFESDSATNLVDMKNRRNQLSIGTEIITGGSSLNVNYIKDGIMNSRHEGDEFRFSLRKNISKFGFENGSYIESNASIDDDKDINVNINMPFR